MSEAAVLPEMISLQPVEDLRRAAEHDPAAVTQLAKRVLVGRDAPFAPDEGMALLEKAMARDEPDAFCTMATFKGAGLRTEQSWPEALDLLERAAALGSADARAQLCIIAGDQALAAKARAGDAGTEVWRALTASVDLKAFVTPGPPVQVCEAPRVWLCENFAAPELCAWLVSRSHGKLKPALMRNATTGVSHALESRTCSDFVIDIVEGGVVMLLLRVRISAATSIPVPHMEPPQIFHYALGQEIKAHFDFLFDGHHSYGRDGKYTGDRLATFLMYLNDGYEGGDLEFPSGHYSYKGKTGDGIFFASQRDGKPDRLSLHAAKPITRGEKYILSQWIHNQPFGG